MLYRLKEARQRLNDSRISQTVNNSIPGLVIECASLRIAEFLKPVESAAQYSFTKLLGLADPFLERLFCEYFRLGKIMDFQTKYSNTSKLWKRARIGFVLGYERVPLKEAIVNRNLEKHDFKMPFLEEVISEETAKPSESTKPFFIPDYGTVNGIPKHLN